MKYLKDLETFIWKILQRLQWLFRLIGGRTPQGGSSNQRRRERRGRKENKDLHHVHSYSHCLELTVFMSFS